VPYDLGLCVEFDLVNRGELPSYHARAPVEEAKSNLCGVATWIQALISDFSTQVAIYSQNLNPWRDPHGHGEDRTVPTVSVRSVQHEISRSRHSPVEVDKSAIFLDRLLRERPRPRRHMDEMVVKIMGRPRLDVSKA
jgi:hypothetical protein